MNEIEAKRKELEQYYFNHGNDDTKFTYKEVIANRLHHFNLGVEMARKEILEWLKIITSGDLDTAFWECKKKIQSLEEKK